MELKPGYKQTEVGALPTDWDLVPFADLLEFRNGVNAEKAAYGTGVRFINVLEVITKSHLCASDIPGRISLPERLTASYQVRPGDVLFNRTSETQEEVGLAAVYVDQEQVVFGGFVIRGRPTSGNDLDTQYSGYALRSPPIRKQVVALGQGAIRANIGQHDLRTVLVPCPPRPEQYAIATALNDIDALLGALDRLIAKKRDLKQAAMQQLLTGQTRLPGFSGKWETRRLGDLGPLSKGKGIRKDDVQAAGLPCVRYGEIYTHHNDIIRSFYSFITPQVARESCLLENGDIIFAGSGETAEEIGKCVAFLGRQETYVGGDTIVLRPIGHDSMFLGYLLNYPSIAVQKARMAQGDAVVHISSRNLATLRVPMPSLKEQMAVAAVFADMDAELTTLEQRRDKTHLLKQGMMQELLTGRTRLV
jgi:type I restriction enzyme S subunit